MATKNPSIDYRQQVMACLRKKPMRTSELAEALGLEKSKMRQTGLRLQSENFVVAKIISGRGKGEYLFTMVQDDLFWQSMSLKMTFWQKLKYLFRFSPT